MEPGSYQTIKKQSEAIYKEKGSKFIAKVFYIETEEQFKGQLEKVKKDYHDARHHCYAYRINPESEQYRSNDDGEPSGTAGKPILNQIYSRELFNVLVVVVRYFGGTKLGVSGLINAYKTATHEALSSAQIETRYIMHQLELNFEYPIINDVMRIIKEENLEILNQFYYHNCVIKLTVKKSNLERVLIRLEKVHKVKFKVLKSR